MIATAQTVTAEATEISGDTKHFIDRDAELKIIREKIEAIKNGKRLFDFILRSGQMVSWRADSPLEIGLFLAQRWRCHVA